MGTFTNVFGHFTSEAPAGTIKSHGQSTIPICKHCGGDLMVLRQNFNVQTRSSDKSFACKQCGKSHDI